MCMCLYAGSRVREREREGVLMYQRATKRVELGKDQEQEQEYYFTQQEREDINSLKRFDYLPTTQDVF